MKCLHNASGLAMMNSIPYVPLDARGILEVLRTHRPDLYRDVMWVASDYAHEALRWQMRQCRETAEANNATPA